MWYIYIYISVILPIGGCDFLLAPWGCPEKTPPLYSAVLTHAAPVGTSGAGDLRGVLVASQHPSQCAAAAGPRSG